MEYKGKVVFSKEQLKVLDLLEQWVLNYCEGNACDIPALMLRLKEILQAWEKAKGNKQKKKFLIFKGGGK